VQFGDLRAVLFKGVEILEEEKPGGLLDIVQFRGLGGQSKAAT